MTEQKIPAVRIVPAADGGTHGTQVLGPDGVPLKYISGLTVEYPLNGRVTAHISLHNVDPAEYVASPLFSIDTLNLMAAHYGLKLEPDASSGRYRIESEWLHPNG